VLINAGVEDDAASTSVVTACSACGSLNRILRARLRDDPTCGRCKEKIFPRRPVAVSDASWKKEVEDSPIPVLVDFWAPWCGPCRMLAPTIEKIAAEYQGRIKVGKLNTDENQETPGGLRISAIPTVLVFQGGKEVERLVGVNTESKFRSTLTKLGVEATA
jgi:thioredoxin 1